MTRPAMISNKLPKAILCDMDGVLVDSEALHWESVIDVLVELGALKAGQRVRERIGWGDHELWSEFAVRFQLNERSEQLTERRAQHAERRLLAAPPLRIPGSREGLLTLKERYPELRMAVVSASPARQMALSLEEYQGLFDCLISGVDDCAENKPSPLPYLSAMQRLNINAEDCWIIEDSPTGLSSAIQSGAQVWCLGDATGSQELTGQLRGRIHSIETLVELIEQGS